MAEPLIHRGSLVACVLAGDFGKPRPAVVVQSDLFNPTHASVSVCPVTTELVAAPLFRIRLEPEENSGLETASDVMVDRVTTIRRARIGGIIGEISQGAMARIDEALARWLGLEV